MASPYCLPADVLARLRLNDQHPDAPYVTECTTAACELIDDRLGYPDPDGAIVLPVPPYPRRLWRAAIGVAVDIYRFKDRESDTAGTWATATAPAPRIPTDVLERYESLLSPDRHVWGIA